MRSSLSPLSSTRLHRVVCVTGHPRDKFAIENIHGYVKRKKKPPLTFNLVNSWVFDTKAREPIRFLYLTPT